MTLDAFKDCTKMENLTSEEVEQKIKEINKITNHGERNKALIDLCHKVGASPCPKDMGNVHVRDAEHIRSIRETLKMKEVIRSSKIADQQLRVTLSKGQSMFTSGTIGKRPSSTDTWNDIHKELENTKLTFAKKINFVTDKYKRKVIFRDIEDAYILAKTGFSKPATILAGSVIEELLRLYLEHNNISPVSNNFDGYIRTCEQKKLLKSGISRLSDSVRYFRNLVHLSGEKTKKYTISKATAQSAVASIFIIANDF